MKETSIINSYAYLVGQCAFKMMTIHLELFENCIFFFFFKAPHFLEGVLVFTDIGCHFAEKHTWL